MGEREHEKGTISDRPGEQSSTSFRLACLMTSCLLVASRVLYVLSYFFWAYGGSRPELQCE